jgi:hypothetical protein
LPFLIFVIEIVVVRYPNNLDEINEDDFVEEEGR